MPSLLAVPPALPSLVASAVALSCLLLGLATLRRRDLPPLCAPLLRLNDSLFEAVRGDAAPQRPPAEAARLYGWALVYAGSFGLIVAGGQFLRLVFAS